jgi:hypothetical protein
MPVGGCYNAHAHRTGRGPEELGVLGQANMNTEHKLRVLPIGAQRSGFKSRSFCSVFRLLELRVSEPLLLVGRQVGLPVRAEGSSVGKEMRENSKWKLCVQHSTVVTARSYSR